MAPLLAIAMAVTGCSRSESDRPLITVDQAHSRLEELFAETSDAFSPAARWTDTEYRTEPDTTGFCGTSGCRKTGAAEMEGRRWAMTRIAGSQASTVLDQVESAWRRQGYPVQRGQYGLKFRTPDASAQLTVDIRGCVWVTADRYDVQDDTLPDGTGGKRFGPPANGSSQTACATVDDPVWSH